MRWSPTYATTLGDHRYDDQLAPRDAAAIARVHRRARRAARAARGARSGARSTPTDRVTLELLRGQLEAEPGTDVCKFHEWSVDAAARACSAS